MKTLSTHVITETVANLCIEACTVLPSHVCNLLRDAHATEPYPSAKIQAWRLCM